MNGLEQKFILEISTLKTSPFGIVIWEEEKDFP